MKRALVLGGGGNVGVAWETAILAGLLDGGIDVREADLVIGTSAGSVVGAHVAHGRDPRDLLREQRQAPPRPLGDVPAPDTSVVAGIFATWGANDTMTQAACAQVGGMVLAAETPLTEERWVDSFDANGWPGWPEKPYLATAVECESGAFRAFDAQSGVPIERATAASCAVPGLFPPVTIEDKRYMDGGVRSGTSADLAQRIEPDIALIVAPLGRGQGRVHLLWARQIAREKGELEAAGVAVRVIQFDDAAMAAGGANLMDAAARIPTADAGEAHARRIAPDLQAWWRGR